MIEFVLAVMASSFKPPLNLNDIAAASQGVALIEISEMKVRMPGVPNERVLLQEARVLEAISGSMLANDEYVLLALTPERDGRQFATPGQWVVFFTECGSFLELPFGRDSILPIYDGGIRGYGEDMVLKTVAWADLKAWYISVVKQDIHVCVTSDWQ